MASIRFNQIADARGSINGTVYSRGIGGLYMKNRVKPLNPQSARQSAVRSQLASLSSGWRALTDAQREAWSAQADNYPATNRVGETYKPSGYQLYMTLNSNLNAVNAPIISVPVAPKGNTAAIIDSSIMELTAGVLTTGSVTLDTAYSADEFILIEATGGLSTGISSPSSSLFKRITSDDSAAATTAFTSDYISVLGSPAVGTKVFIKVFLVDADTGQRTLIGKTSVVVTTA